MRLSELAFFTDNVKGMAGFYRTLLGTEPVAQSPEMVVFINNGVKIFIHATYTPKEGELSPENHTAFEVEDVDVACAALTGQGLSVEVPPTDYYWGRSAYLRNPDGYLIEIIKSSPEDK